MLESKVAVVTGGTSGIGAQVCRDLAKRGWRVIFVGRDRARGQVGLDELSALATAAGGGAPHFIQADLSVPADVERLVSEVQAQTGVLDALVHSAGSLFTKRQETAHGLEMTLVTQYLVRVQLTRALEPLLKKSVEPRIVLVGAPVMKKAKINWDDPHYRRGFSLMNTMTQSQLASHLFAQEYARRNPNGPTINVANVGIVKSGIQREMSGPMALVFKLVGLFSAIPVEKGAANSVALAVDASVKGITGCFFSKPGDLAKRERLTLSTESAGRLWDASDTWAQPQQ
jgi:NAD(P)-dependent dehydrogenase (short-subunit alcohol dehydrogenase family)